MKTCEDRLHLAGDGLKVQCSRETEGQIEGQFDYARLRLSAELLSCGRVGHLAWRSFGAVRYGRLLTCQSQSISKDGGGGG